MRNRLAETVRTISKDTRDRSRSKEPSSDALEVEWSRLSAQLAQGEDYKQLITRHDEDAGFLCEKAARLCWQACNHEIEKHRNRLREVNLATMKQLNSMKCRGGMDESSFVDYYEPLKFLDDTSRELVLTVVESKLHDLVSGSAPPSLLKALGLASDLGPGNAIPEWLVDTMSRREGMELRPKPQKLPTEDHFQDWKSDQSDQGDLFDENQRLQNTIRESEERIANLQSKLAESNRSLVDSQEEVTGARERTKEAQARLQEVLEDYQGRTEALSMAELTIKSLQRQLEQSEAQLKAMEAEGTEGAEEGEKEECAPVAEGGKRPTIMLKLREELKQVKEENQSLKAMLEELKLKTRKFMAELNAKGMNDDVVEICDRVGLQSFMKAKTAFQRLYDDAMNRMQKLDKLREKANSSNDARYHIASRVVFETAVQESTILESADKVQGRNSLSIIGPTNQQLREAQATVARLEAQIRGEEPPAAAQPLQSPNGAYTNPRSWRASRGSAHDMTLTNSSSKESVGRMGSKESVGRIGSKHTPRGSRPQPLPDLFAGNRSDGFSMQRGPRTHFVRPAAPTFLTSKPQGPILGGHLQPQQVQQPQPPQQQLRGRSPRSSMRVVDTRPRTGDDLAMPGVAHLPQAPGPQPPGHPPVPQPQPPQQVGRTPSKSLPSAKTPREAAQVKLPSPVGNKSKSLAVNPSWSMLPDGAEKQ